MLGSWKVVQRGSIAATAAGLACLVSCGGRQFASGESGGAGGSGAGQPSAGSRTGGSSSGGKGSAGDEADGGAPTPGGSAGSGGVVSSGCDCPPGNYCRDGSSDCFECAELSRLRFHPPERLDTLSSANRASRFPRVGETSTDLLYGVEGLGMRYTTDASTSAGNLVMASQPQDSGPLLLAEQVTSLPAAQMAFNFAFDRLVEPTKRRMFFGVWQGGLTTAGLAPGPYNGQGNSDYSIAIATNPTADGVARAYWMTDRDRDPMLGLILMTSLLSATPNGAPVKLEVGAKDCPPDESDLTPWVTSDGKTLLFSNTRVDGTCTITHQGKDLYTALLQPTTGQPTAPAVPIFDVNSPGNDVDPSFSADFCDLYFSSDRDGSYALYRAHRR
ncbi:MAG TPA: hypothetical protein VJN18_24275 [Polyangiaceae bacterium]|nr:hypothetical protein [Polyangiaceae bacterium]